MVQYIYFVKCPDCEDEHFDFFNDAKDFALGCLSKKPIITQTEVNRNDFGECVDSCDLGTVWSWEDMVKDTEEEPLSTFSKYETVGVDLDSDPEFTALDNSLDDIPDNFCRPVPADMSIDALVEEMEENEDTVECKWCEELFDKSECRYEVDLGWLCSRCEAAIKSRGEPLTFRENNYWDFLDESITLDTSNIIDASDFEIWGIEPTTENHFKAVLMKRFENVDCHSSDAIQKVNDEMHAIGGLFVFMFDKDKSPVLDSWNTRLLSELSHCEISFDDLRYEGALKNVFDRKTQALTEATGKETVDLEYDDLTITITGPKRDVDDWDEVTHTDSFIYTVDKDEVATVIWENFITEEDVVDVAGGLDALEDDIAWEKYLVTHFDTLFDKYYDALLEFFKEGAVTAFEDSYSWDDYQADRGFERTNSYFDESVEAEAKGVKSVLEELEDSDTYRARLSLCPECGTDSFDHETGICISCGFN